MRLTTLCLITATILTATTDASAQLQGIAGSSNQAAARGGNDDCVNCTPVNGPGTYNFDNLTASMDGVPDILCDFYGTQDIDFDVWFCYTAASTATAVVNTCNQTTVDTKMAAYDGGCGSPILTCNDDACGLQSQLTFPVVAGNSYLLRIGTYPGAAGGPGTFTITEGGGGGGGNDDCANATPLSGDGVFAVDNTIGTGLDANPGCGNASADVWYEWTAAATGTVVMDMCDGSTLHDTILAIWDGAGCPTVLLDCSDDACGAQSTVSTPVIAGGVYMVQLAGYAGAQGRELDSAAMQGVVYVDSRAGAEVEAGDVTFAGAEIHAELGEALAGGKEARVGEITIFESLGLAIEDVAAAQLVYDSVRRDR